MLAGIFSGAPFREQLSFPRSGLVISLGLLLVGGGGGGLVELCELGDLVHDIGGVLVLELVEDGALLVSPEVHLRVLRPLRKELRLHPNRLQQLRQSRNRATAPQPVLLLHHGLERRRARVHTVVALVRLRLQPKLLPLRQDLSTQRRRRPLLRVRRPEQLPPELGPRVVRRRPVHHEVVHLSPRSHVSLPHRHEEGVEHVQRLPLHLELPAVEASAKLHPVPRRLHLLPLSLQLVAGPLQLLASLLRVVSLPLLQRLRPLQPELLLELVRRHVQLLGVEEGGLGRDRVVVLVDQLALVDRLGLDHALTLDLDALLGQEVLHQLLHGVSTRVRLDKHKRGVVCRRDPLLQRSIPLRTLLLHVRLERARLLHADAHRALLAHHPRKDLHQLNVPLLTQQVRSLQSNARRVTHTLDLHLLRLRRVRQDTLRRLNVPRHNASDVNLLVRFRRQAHVHKVLPPRLPLPRLPLRARLSRRRGLRARLRARGLVRHFALLSSLNRFDERLTRPGAKKYRN
eukprot:Hpha_TRINITY_DN15850_c1_g7::TRINITY_DN15850_c1_g7_i3::g.192247::m.192247